MPGSPKSISPASKGSLSPVIDTPLPLLSIDTCGHRQQVGGAGQRVAIWCCTISETAQLPLSNAAPTFAPRCSLGRALPD